jgi:hypothetical protein
MASMRKLSILATILVLTLNAATQAASVVARGTYYLDPAVSAAKQPLLPGQVGSVLNVTNKTYGLTGVTVDVTGLPGPVSASDFLLRTGNSTDFGTWTTPAGAPTVSLLPAGGVGGSDRVVVDLAALSIADTWLEVSVLPSAGTGLGSRDVFFFGNLGGDVNGDLAVTPMDELLIIDYLNDTLGDPNVGLDSPLDVSGDGFATAMDALVMTNILNVGAPAPLVALPEPTTLSLLAVGLAAIKMRQRR